MGNVPARIFGFIIALGASAAIAAESPERPAVTISKAGWAVADKSGAYVAGRSITVAVAVKGGSSPSSIHLKDHDKYHGTLDYPTSIAIRVVDEQGRVLTTNDLSHDDWWSRYYLWSTLFADMPGDVIELSPGEEVIRIVPIDQVLLGCPSLDGGLRPGHYAVQLRVDGVLSNELGIDVRSETKDGRAPSNQVLQQR